MKKSLSSIRGGICSVRRRPYYLRVRVTQKACPTTQVAGLRERPRARCAMSPPDCLGNGRSSFCNTLPHLLSTLPARWQRVRRIAEFPCANCCKLLRTRPISILFCMGLRMSTRFYIQKRPPKKAFPIPQLKIVTIVPKHRSRIHNEKENISLTSQSDW